jgi:hypothetical protein
MQGAKDITDRRVVVAVFLEGQQRAVEDAQMVPGVVKKVLYQFRIFHPWS